jgi:predicted short-subunit dehydrogenase-like oxidoreductase (DUF2520 family)
MSAPLRIAVVGAGRVGGVVGTALQRAGHEIVVASGGTRLFPDVPRTSPDAVERADVDLLLVAVPDDVLGRMNPEPRAGRRVAHTSGAYGLPAGFDLALHPAMTFTGTADDLDRLPGISWGVTAHDRVFAARLVADLGGVPEWIADDARPLYHAALAHGANHLVTLVNDAADALRAAGVADPARVLRPLLTAALDNALRTGDRALTGPVSRGDAGTVERHLAVLAPEVRDAYRALALRTVERAGLEPAAAEQVRTALEGVRA